MKGGRPARRRRTRPRFGAKAVGLGQALRDGLPVPPGIALVGRDRRRRGRAGEAGHRARSRKRPARSAAPLAVRSSAVDEDGADASFAGQHLTLLNVPSVDELSAAVREIWWSANSDSAITYRQTRRPLHAPERRRRRAVAARPRHRRGDVHAEPGQRSRRAVIEASWGLGEVVVAGRVIPDNFRIDRVRAGARAHAGASRRSRSGPRPTAARSTRTSRPSCVEQLCLDDDQLAELNALAGRARRSTARRGTSSGRSPAGRSTCSSAARSRGPGP